MAAKLVHEERNTFDHVKCPSCSRLHQVEDDKGPIEIPRRCLRCKCDMEDMQAADDFINGNAVKEHDDATTESGQKLRGEHPTQLAAAAGADVDVLLQAMTEGLQQGFQLLAESVVQALNIKGMVEAEIARQIVGPTTDDTPKPRSK